ncbi:MAG TPA: hypothetical protein VGM39_16655 [Kofleriaceae bacterium]|jgi:hypothetical protein
MTNLQTLTIDQLSTISGGQGGTRSALPANTPTGSPATSTGSSASGAAPRSAPINWQNSVDVTGSADTDRNWNVRVQGEHRFNDQFTVDAHVQTGARNGHNSTEIGGGLHFRF